jgi:lipopolysaccharide export system protein LptA
LSTKSGQKAASYDARTLITQQAAMTLSPDGASIKDLKTQGPSTMEIFPVKPGEDKRTVRAEKFLFAFGADGELNDFTAEGKVSVIAEGTGKQPRPRTSTSDNLLASFDKQTHNVSRMRKWGSFSYQDADRKARSDKAEYDTLNAVIVLDDNVRIWNADGTVTAKNAVLNTVSGDMKAEGGVSTNYISQNTTGPAAPSPVNVSADRLDYNTRTQKASYQGHSRLWQGTNMIQADTIEVDRKTSRLTAQKNVYSIFGIPKDNTSKPTAVKNPAVSVTDDNSGPVEVRSEELMYDDEKNRATYHKNVRMKNTSASLTCEELELQFKPRPSNAAQADLQIDRAIATQNVHVIQPTRQATAERAEYVPDEKKITLTGNLAAISDSEKGSTQGIRLTYFTGDDRILVDGKPGTQAETKRTVRP